MPGYMCPTQDHLAGAADPSSLVARVRAALENLDAEKVLLVASAVGLAGAGYVVMSGLARVF
jgi:hypothetical protein